MDLKYDQVLKYDAYPVISSPSPRISIHNALCQRAGSTIPQQMQPITMALLVSKMTLEQRLNVMLMFAWLVYLCYAVSVFLEPPPAPRLPTSKVVEYIEKRKFPIVDAVLLGPCVYGKDGDGQTVNLTMISILRFAPWINRIHVDLSNVPDDVETTRETVDEPSFKVWTEKKTQKLVYFDQPLITYTTTTPFLAERFMVVKPQCVLTNYVFSWQLFIGDSPVYRSSYNAIVPLTRTTYNELAFANGPTGPKNTFDHVQKLSLRRRETKWMNNQDHYIPACSALDQKSVTYFSKPDPAKVTQLLHHIQPKKTVSRDKPTTVVLCVVDDASADLFVEAKDQLQTIQIWVLLGKVSPTDHLSFIHRSLVQHNLYICTGKVTNAESTGATIMQKMRDYPVVVGTVFCTPKTRTLATRLAQAYNVGIEELTVLREPNVDEIKRLKLL